MNKLFTKIVGVALGLTMAIGVGVAVASNSKEVTPVHAAGKDDWVQVTALSGLNTTDTYVIANDADKGYFMNGTANSGHFQSTAFGASAPANATAAGAFKLEAVDATNNIYKIKLVSTNKYVKASKAASGGGTVSDTEDNAGWKFLSSGTSFNAIYQTAYSGKYAAMRCYNNTSWRTYSNNTATAISATNGTVFRLYKYQDAALSSISVKTSPKTSYVQGDHFDPTGLVITRNYSDSTSNDYEYAGHTSEFTFSPTTSTALTTSHTSVTITYGGKTCNQAITVTAPKTPSSLSSTGQTTSFEAGETFTYGGTLTVTYTDSTGGTVSPGSFKIGSAGINPTSAGTVITPGTTILNRDDHHGKTIYVLYTENATTVYTSYTISVAAVSKVTFTGGTDTGTAGGQGQSDSLTKSGVTMACDSCYTTSGAYRFYANAILTISSTVGNIAQIEFNMNGSSYNSNLLSTSTGTYNSSVSTKGIWTGDAASIDFRLSAQARVNSIVITLASNDPTVELDATSATEVSMMKGDTDTTVKVHVANITTKNWAFTFDEGGSTGLFTSAYISVSAGTAVSDVHTLTITTKAVGSTTMHIAVSGTACETAVPVTVNAKPASMTIVHSDIHQGELEILTDAYKQVSFTGKDTDGNDYAIAAADVSSSATSGSSYVTLSGTRITGVSEGYAVVKYTLNALASVYAEITVHVVNDYIETVGEPKFATGLEDTQGQSPTVSVFTSRPGTMRSGTATTVPFENFKFSYDQTYASAQYGSVFTYDFSHGTTVDSTHKLQTIYVFCDIDEVVHGSYTVTVEQLDDPLQTISFTDPANHALSITRGGSYKLEWEYSPANPTDGKEVKFVVDTNANNIDITVSLTGSVSIGSTSNLGTAKVLIQSAHDDTIQDYVNITATLETMKYTVSEEESLTPVSTVSSGDRVYMVGTATDHSNATYEFNGYPGTYGGATAYTTTVAKLQLLIVEAGTESGTVAFKLSGGDNDGEYISYSGSSNTLNHTSTKDKSASWTVNGSTITNANTTARQMWMNWNNGTPRFACYTNKTSTTGYYCPTFAKVTGGDTPYTVTETLFNGVHNNFGDDGQTYEWDATCSSFDEDAWLDACDALTKITSYSSYKLNRAVANISGNEIEVFLAKYDAIIGKFGTTHDHLDRFAQGGINYGVRSSVSPLVNIIGENTNTVTIIVIISMISITAIGGYFFYRKRKEI